MRVKEVGAGPAEALRFPDLLLCPKLSVNETRMRQLRLSEPLFAFIWAKTRFPAPAPAPGTAFAIFAIDDFE